MGQQEVLEWLREQRKSGDNWFTTKEIKEAMREKGLSNGCIIKVYDNLYKLTSFDIIECRGVGLWDHHKEFRAYK